MSDPVPSIKAPDAVSVSHKSPAAFIKSDVVAKVLTSTSTMAMQEKFFAQVKKAGLTLTSATTNRITPHELTTNKAAIMERAFYAKQEATRRLDNPSAPPVKVPVSVNLSEAQIQKTVETIKEIADTWLKKNSRQTIRMCLPLLN